MRVVCTAGHVDHGKSTLVRALTGMEPDRLAEERRRGLTIDLGFAWASLSPVEAEAPPETVAFVDLPGHERFVGTMLAGAGAVDCALFVVAVDEGWMPQSAEHLAILDLLGVRHGLVALTKADTADAETAEIAAELVREQLAPTTFRDAPILPVSAATGAGLQRLVDALLTVLDAAGVPADRGRPRLWVDRSFSVRGAGTVVTGTLAGGAIATGDELSVLPGRRTGRVRGLQSLQVPVDRAGPGERVAVNLSGVEREQVARGDALGFAGQWRSVRTLDASVRVLPGMTAGRSGAWHFHAGSAERTARLFPLMGGPIDGTGLLRVELDRALALTAGDRFVLREAGRRATIGGGLVLDADPLPRPRGSRARRERAAALEARAAALAAGDHAALLALHVRERGAADLHAAAAACGLDTAAAMDAAGTHGLLPLAASLVSREAAGAWARGVRAAVEGHHRDHPVERVAPRDVAVRAAQAAGCPPDLAGPFLDALVATGRLVAESSQSLTGVRLPEHTVRLDPADVAARDALLAALTQRPFAPPPLSAAARAAGASPALVRELEAEGTIARIGPDLAVTTAALDAATERLGAAAATEGPLTAARAKEVLETTRKYALPLLEELDRRGRTRRRGDVRDVVG